MPPRSTQMRSLFLALALSVPPSSAHAEEPAHETRGESEETEASEETAETSPHKVVPRLHAGIAFRFDFEETPHRYEPFLIVGGGLLAHLHERIGFVPSLTIAMAPTGTWGFGLNAEVEFKVSRHFAIDVIHSLCQETGIADRHTDLVGAAGIGFSALLEKDVMLTIGVQGGVNLETGEWAFYPLLDFAIPFPGQKPAH